MPEQVERTIYRLGIDDTEYIAGIDRMTASTKQLTDAQAKANQTLQTNQAALKNASEVLKKAKQDLDSYTGTNTRYRDQLAKDFQNAQVEEKKLTELVAGNQKAYEAATKAAQQFADVSARATQLQQSTTGGKIGPTFAPQVAVPQLPTNITGLQEAAAATTDEFQQLAAAIGLAEAEMQNLDKESEEFKTLAPIVAQGKEVLDLYGKTVEQVDEKHISLRQQIRLNNDELARLEQTGQGTTKRYIELEKETAKLSDLYQEQRERIKILASDTRAFDFGKAAVESAVSGFQLYTSIAVLAGGASEKLEKETLQLFAAMQLLTGLEQLANQVKRGGVIATNLQSVAQATYTAVVGASTGALKAFRLALLGTGIGAAVVAIGFLVKKYIEYKDSIAEAQEQQKVFNEVVEQGNKDAGKQLADLKILTQTARDSTLPFKERTAAVKELQKEFPAYLGNLKQEQILTGDITKATNELTDSIIASSRARAANQKIDELESQRLDLRQAQADIEKKLQENTTKQQAANRKDQRDAEQRGLDQFNAISERSQLQRDLDDKKNKEAQLDRQEDFLIKSFGLTKLADDREEKDKTDKTKKQTAAIQNEFLQRKAELDKQLADARRSEIENEAAIRADFAARLTKQLQDIDKALKDKKLTLPQSKILITESIDVNKSQLDKALADFNKKVADARQKLNDELRTLQEKANTDTLNLIQDEFDRRKALIDANEQREIEDQKAATEERLKSLDFDRLLIGEENYQRAKAIIVTAGEQEINNIILRAAQERQDLSADIFKRTLDAYDKAVENIGFIQDRRQSEDVQKEADRFLRGEINYEQFQKNLDAINRRHLSQRNRDSITELENELKAINARLATIDINLPTAPKPGEPQQVVQPDTSKEVEDLVERQKRVSQQLSNLRKDDSEADAKDRDQLLQERLKSVQSYASAIGDLAQSVVSFWQTANEAEQKALDRSIEIQQRRVDEAQKIAERGNAQYLKEETDRLKELQLARENAARRQLAIDAALQASQILVAVTGAISKIATPGIGVAETIAEIAVIVGALATGYGLVKSLQGNQPRLKTGTTYLQRGKHPAGEDTIPAWLNEGEAVIPTDKNRKYKQAVEAIYHEKVPADVLNNFVQNYHQIKPIPQPNYEKIKQVNETKITQDGRLAVIMQEHTRKLDENNELQKTTQKILKTMGMSISMDKRGFAASWMEYVEQEKKNKTL